MSRLEIHMGLHNHAPWKSSSRESMKKAGELLKRQYDASPSSNPMRLKVLVIGELMSMVAIDSEKEISMGFQMELGKPLKIVSPPKFATMLKSIKKEILQAREIEGLQCMHKNTLFPFLH